MERISDLSRSKDEPPGDKSVDKSKPSKSVGGGQKNLIQVSTKVCSKLRSQIYPLIRLKRRHNTVHSDSVFLDVLTHTALTQGFTEGGSKTFQIMHPDSPHVNTILHHIRKFNPKEAEELFKNVSMNIFEQAKKLGVLDGRLDVAIDITDEPFYGDKDTPMVLGTKPGRGTTYAYKFATLTIISKGRRFTVAAVPVGLFDTLAKLVNTLIVEAKQFIKIRIVMLDRAFNSVECITVLEKHGLKFLMPARQSAKVNRAIESGETIIPYTMRSGSRKRGSQGTTATFNLLVVPSTKHHGKMTGFFTNANLGENHVIEFAKQYGKRWGIETAYRVQDKFRIRTTSKNHVVRLFYFLYSVMLYNIWALVNLNVSITLNESQDKPIINAQMIATMITNTDYG